MKDTNLEQYIMLLTDGQSNIILSRWHVAILKQYSDTLTLRCTLNTFGFGYNLDSKLLYDIARSSNCTYSFIPDSSIIGTCFINKISSLLACVATYVVCDIELDYNVINKKQHLQYLDYSKTDTGIRINIGSIQSGQSFYIIIPGLFESLNIKLTYFIQSNTNQFSISDNYTVQTT